MSEFACLIIGALLGAICGLFCSLMERVTIIVHLKPKGDESQRGAP